MRSLDIIELALEHGSIRVGGAAGADEVRQVEEALGVRFPEDYREFLSRFGGLHAPAGAEHLEGRLTVFAAGELIEGRRLFRELFDEWLPTGWLDSTDADPDQDDDLYDAIRPAYRSFAPILTGSYENMHQDTVCLDPDGGVHNVSIKSATSEAAITGFTRALIGTLAEIEVADPVLAAADRWLAGSDPDPTGYQPSRERIRQVEASAMRKLRAGRMDLSAVLSYLDDDDDSPTGAR